MLSYWCGCWRAEAGTLTPQRDTGDRTMLLLRIFLTGSSCGHKAVCRQIASRSLVVSIIHRLMVKMDSLLPRLTKRNLSPSTIKLELMDERLQLFGNSARFEKGKMNVFIDGQLCCFRPRKKPSDASSVKQANQFSLPLQGQITDVLITRNSC